MRNFVHGVRRQVRRPPNTLKANVLPSSIYVVTDETRSPACVHPPAACDNEHTYIQQALPYEVIKQSGTRCLNMNIVTPKQLPAGPLPVFVFVHGGGFAIGSNAFPQYNSTRLVELSVKRRTPVIGITIK